MKWNRYADVAVRSPKKTLAMWAGFFGLMAVFLVVKPKIEIDPTFNNMIMTNDPDKKANHDQKLIFGDDEYAVIAVHNEKGIFNKETLAQIDRLTSEILKLDGIKDVYSVTHVDNIKSNPNGDLNTLDFITELPTDAAEIAALEREAFHNNTYELNILSSDKTVAGINVEFSMAMPTIQERSPILEKIQALVERENAAGPGTVYLTGFPYASYLGGIYMIIDMVVFCGLASLILVVLMWIFFRKVQGIVFTFAVAMVAVAGTFGMLTLAGFKVSMPLSGMMGFVMALGMEYSIYVAYAYISQIIEEQQKGRSIRDPKLVLSEALWEVRGPVMVSAGTTAVAFLSMWSNPVPELAKMGIFMAIGTTISGFAAMTIVPAVISLFPYTVSHTKPPNRFVTWVLGNISASAVKRPKVHLLAMTAILAFGFVGWMQLSHDTDAIQYFREDADIRISENFIREKLGGTTFLPVILTADREDYFKEPENLAKLAALQKFAEKLPHVTQTLSHADHLKLINRAMHKDAPEAYVLPKSKALVEQFLLLHGNPDDFRTVISDDYKIANVQLRVDTMSAKVLGNIETQVEGFLHDKYPELSSNLVGTNLLVHRAFDMMATSMLISLGQALLVIWVILIFVFKSIKWGTLALIPNTIPVALNYGILGWIGYPLDPPAAVTGAIALGIAVDDTVHFFTTWRTNMRKNGYDSANAVRETLARIGRPMVLSSLVLGLGFGVMLASRYGTLVWMAVMLCVATFSALISDLLFTPALLRLSTDKLPLPENNKLDTALKTERQLLGGQPVIQPDKMDLKYFTDDEITKMHAYDLFAVAGKTVLRHGWMQGSRRLYHELQLKPGMRVLEFGPGVGHGAITFAKEFGVEYWGLDSCESYARSATKLTQKHGVAEHCHFIVGDGASAPFPENFFDVVIVESVVLYASTAHIFPEAYRVLKPGGEIGVHDWSWAQKPPLIMDDLTCIDVCTCRRGSLCILDQAAWEEQFRYANFDISFYEDRSFTFFSFKRIFDDEGFRDGMKMFWRILKRRAALQHFLKIIFFLGKYEPWYSYTLAIGKKPQKGAKRSFSDATLKTQQALQPKQQESA